MSKVYIVAAKRTAIGSFLGALSTVSPAMFASTVVKDILESTKIPADALDEVIVGNILPAGQGQGIARQVAIHAGIPESVPAYAVNMVCGSGMKSIMNAYASIKAGMHQLVLAGGTESMSQAPYLMPNQARSGIKMGNITLKDHMIDDALIDAFTGIHMGVTAENIVRKYGITREEQDAFAWQSQQKAIRAVDTGVFKDEIVPVEVKSRKEVIVFDTDEYPNRTTNLEKLAKLRAVFEKDGTVTAGNASGINDGASFVLVASEEAVHQYDLNPLVEIVAVGQGGVDPNVMGMGPVPAIEQALDACGMTLADMNLLELNEAFAAQSIGVLKELASRYETTVDAIVARTNVNGGAIALGHPVGASGNRIVTTLIHEMIRQKHAYGLASLCIGGGMGTAIIVKRTEERQ